MVNRLLIFILIASSFAVAQGSRRDDSALGTGGKPIPRPTVRVCAEDATGVPCTPLADIKTDKTLSTASANPFTGDSFGNFFFYAAPGWYKVQVSGAGVSPYTYTVLLPPDVKNMGAISVPSVSSTETSPSASGMLRLGEDESICWRNEANTDDVCIAKNDSDSITGLAASTNAQSLTSDSANPAATGKVKLAQDDIVCWRNEANSGDVCLSKNGSDQIAGNFAGITSQTRKLVFPAAACNNATAAPAFDLPTTNAPTYSCYGTNVRFGALDWADGGSQKTAFVHFRLPDTWTGNIDAVIMYFSPATSGNTDWQIQTGCGTFPAMTSGPTLNAANVASDGAAGTANGLNDAFFTNITKTGCDAGDEMFVAVSRGTSDTNASTASMVSLELTIRTSE